MPRNTYMVLHKTEWERLKSQGSRTEDSPPKQDAREEYFKGLVEMSQNWMNSWPDSVVGKVTHAKEKQDDQRRHDMELINEFRRRLPKDNARIIQEAKRKIYNNTCYGKQLVSAIRESKLMEEREAQIEFNKKLKEKQNQKGMELHNMEMASLTAIEEVEKNKQKQRRIDALGLVEWNKEIVRQKKAEQAKLKKEEECYLIYEKQIKEESDREKKIEEEHKLKVKEELDEVEAARKVIENQRILKNTHEDMLTELYRKQKDRLNCKINQLRKQYIHDSHMSKSKQVYEIMEKNIIEDQRRYHEFVEKGIKMSEEREKLLDEATKTKQKQTNEPNDSIKLTPDDRSGKDWCKCDRSSLFVKSCGKKRPDQNKGVGLSKEIKEEKHSKPKHDFLKPKNPLLEALKLRRTEKSPYSGTEGAHAQFVQHATVALNDSKYKVYARKVIDEYRISNGLDSTTLPVSNY